LESECLHCLPWASGPILRISVCNWQIKEKYMDAIVSVAEHAVATAANQVAIPHPSKTGKSKGYFAL
jgi:hypothetical protein